MTFSSCYRRWYDARLAGQNSQPVVFTMRQRRKKASYGFWKRNGEKRYFLLRQYRCVKFEKKQLFNKIILARNERACVAA